jgi:ATP/maltotriose-dependent transcriptional regulator MalT
MSTGDLPEGNETLSPENNAKIKALLQRRAKEKGSSLKWNANTLILAYTILATTIILELRSVNIAIVAAIAVLGLVFIWTYSYQQAKKMERQFLKEELHVYSDLFAGRSKADRDINVIATSVKSIESPLTERELQVLGLLGEGKSNKETAVILHISDQTVKNHISHIFTKLGVNDRTSAVLMAISQGWIKNADIDHSRTPLDKNQ